MARKILDRYKMHSSLCPARAIDEFLSQGNIMNGNRDTMFQLLDELIIHEKELRKIRQRLEAVLQVHKMNQLRSSETEADCVVRTHLLNNSRRN